jgi:hypothetical protein
MTMAHDAWRTTSIFRFRSLTNNLNFYTNPSCAIVIRWFSLNEASLGLFKFNSDCLPYFEKINIFFNIIAKKFELIYKDWSKLFVQFIRNNLNQFKENHLMTTARDALRTTSIFRFRSLTNNLNFLNQAKHV